MWALGPLSGRAGEAEAGGGREADMLAPEAGWLPVLVLQCAEAQLLLELPDIGQELLKTAPAPAE